MIYEIDSSKTNALRTSPPKKSTRFLCNASNFCDGVENCTTAKGGVKYFMSDVKYMEHMMDEHQVVVNVKAPEVSPLKKGAGTLKSDDRVEEPSMFAPYYANKSNSAKSTKTDVMDEDDESVEDSRDVAIMAMQKQIDELAIAMQHILVLLTPPAQPKSQPTKVIKKTKKTKKIATPVLSEQEDDEDEEVELPVMFTPVVQKTVGRPKKATPK